MVGAFFNSQILFLFIVAAPVAIIRILSPTSSGDNLVLFFCIIYITIQTFALYGKGVISRRNSALFLMLILFATAGSWMIFHNLIISSALVWFLSSVFVLVLQKNSQT